MPYHLWMGNIVNIATDAIGKCCKHRTEAYAGDL